MLLFQSVVPPWDTKNPGKVCRVLSLLIIILKQINPFDCRVCANNPSEEIPKVLFSEVILFLRMTKQVSCLQIKVLLSAELRRPSRVPFTVQTRLSYEFQLPMTTVHAPVHKGEDLLVAEICLPHFVAGQTAVLLPTDGHHAL